MNADSKWNLDWMNQYGPRFTVPAQNIQVLQTPKQFYQSFLNLIKNSTCRINISTLYFGTGVLDKALVSTLELAMQHHPCMQMRIMLDYCRGKRGRINSCTTLEPLLKEKYRENIKVSLYHTPDLRGVLKGVLPGYWKELMGVQHMKIYVFDDNIIITGANLSECYFTDRQDRYMVIKDCPLLADYLCDIQATVESASFVLQPLGGVVLADECFVHPFTFSASHCGFHQMLKRRILDVVQRWYTLTCNHTHYEKKNDTVIYPLIQMGSIGILDDNKVHKHLFSAQDYGSMDIVSCYCNLVDDYENLIAKKSRKNIRILAASPKCNAFYKGKGFSKFIPSLYGRIMKQFHNSLSILGQNERVGLFEYERNDWTFHAKGVWWSPTNETQPAMTLIGSPNYGYRSVHRDLEMELMIITSNQSLRDQFYQERKCIFDYATPVSNATYQTKDHHVPWFLKILLPIIKNYM